jgi:4-aminobutyrate aminotransferase-like enzyme
VDFIEENHLAHNAAQVGGYLRAGLESLKEKFPIIGDVRGMGLLQALELVEDRQSKKPANQVTLRVMEAARRNRILIGKGGLYGNVLRISPPMNIQKSDVDTFLLALDKSFVAAETGR